VFKKDPYFFKNHVGSFECRLCLTVHQNDGSYLAHTQGRKHQTNLSRRAAREQHDGKNIDKVTGLPTGMIGQQIAVRKNVLKIGRPGYKITKCRDPVTRQTGLLFQLQYPEIGTEIHPRHRFMSAFEQKVEVPPDKDYQYLLVAAEPYETVAFKLQAREVDRSQGKFWTHYDADTKEFFLQLFFKTEREERCKFLFYLFIHPIYLYAAFHFRSEDLLIQRCRCGCSWTGTFGGSSVRDGQRVVAVRLNVWNFLYHWISTLLKSVEGNMTQLVKPLFEG